MNWDNSHPLNVLVVEDDIVAANMMESLLKETPHKVTFVEEGEDAINLLENQQPVDLIFLDYHLPKMDGRTFCKIVRTSKIAEDYPNLWIVAHTQEQRFGLIKEVFEAGANDYLPKPIVPWVFLLRLMAAEYGLKRHTHLMRRLEVKQKLIEGA